MTASSPPIDISPEMHADMQAALKVFREFWDRLAESFRAMSPQINYLAALLAELKLDGPAGYPARQYRRERRADPTRLRRRHMHHQYRRRGR